MRTRFGARGAALLLRGALAMSGCSDSSGGEDADGDAVEEAGEEPGDEPVDQSVCRAEATEIPAPYAEGFPSAWTFPTDTTVYDVEERPDVGVIVTAVSSAPFDAVLDHLNTADVDAGFVITDGETEEDDAEANWDSGDQRGRWSIRKSGTCEGETVIQVFAALD